MLPITAELQNYINSDLKKNGSIISAYANAILRFGDITDGEAIFRMYLEDPGDFYYNLYFSALLKKWLTHEQADLLFDKCFENGLLKEGSSETVLEILAAVQYPPVKPVLAHYVFTTNEYYLNASATLGLLNYDCAEYEEEIIAEIKKTFGQNLFKEFVPALVSKINDRSALLEELYILGNETASSDCNGGILLGFSLCGNEGLPYFRQTLFNQQWEVGSSATGSLSMAYTGLKNLNITFDALFGEMMEIADEEHFRYAMSVFLNLLSQRSADTSANNPTGSAADLFQQFFTWKNGNLRDNLIDIAAKAGLEDRASEIEDLLAKAVEEELFNKCIQHKLS